MKPALIRYSEESEASPACASAVDVQFNVIPSTAIKIPILLNITFPARECSSLRGQSPIESKLERHTAVDRALDLGRSGGYEIWNEFQMPVIQQVLAADRKFDPRNRSPA